MSIQPDSSFPEDGGVPPVVHCVWCGRGDCAGCTAPLSPNPASTILAWETGKGSFHQRLWRTALASSTEPLRVFGEMPEGRIWPALGFALLAETVALGSIGSLFVALALALAPDLWSRILSSPSVIAFATGVLLLSIFLMVGLHALWGICVELGANLAGTPGHYGHGLRFGLYACGWDLLTSPAGVVHGVLARGFRRAWGPLVSAVRAPRVGLRAYVENCRGLDGRARRRGNQLSVAVLGGAVLLISATVVLFAVEVLLSVG